MNKEYFDLKEDTLENGLKIISIKKAGQIFSVQLSVKVGPVCEKESEKGLSHFIEHMLFKGTKNRTNAEINEDIEDRAGSFIAYTSYLNTVYGITALKEELDDSLNILSDIVINPIFPVKEFKKEKKVIISELKGSLDDLENYSFNHIHDIAFKKSFLKWDIVGKESLLKGYKVDDLIEFYKRYYVASNAIISIVSPYNNDEVLAIVKNYFNGWKSGEVEPLEVVNENNIEKFRSMKKKDIEQSTITYLYTFHGLTKREELALEILNYRLGESSNSALFKKLREDNGLTYEIYSDVDVSPNIKILSIYTSLDKENVSKAKEMIDSVIESFKESGTVEKRNINSMKKVVKTGIASMLISPESLCNYALYQKILNKDIYEFKEDLKMIEDIDENEIREIAKKILKNPTVQIVFNED